MSNSEEISYSLEFEDDNNSSKSKPSISSRSISTTTNLKNVHENTKQIDRGSKSSGSSIHNQSLEKEDKSGVPSGSSAVRTQSGLDEEESSDEAQSVASQQFSNAIEKYEERLSKAEKSKSSTDLSDISEIMRQLENMEKARGDLENFVDNEIEDVLSSEPRKGLKSSASTSKSSIKSLDSATSLPKSDTSTLRKSEVSEIDEIDDIIKKLESLEKAQSALENALSQSEAEVSGSSGANSPSKKYKSQSSNTTHSKQAPNKSKSRSSIQQKSRSGVIEPGIQGDADTADEMSELNSNDKRNSSMELFKTPALMESFLSKNELKVTQYERTNEPHSIQSIPAFSVLQTSNAKVEESRISTMTQQYQRNQGSERVSPVDQQKIEENLRNEVIRQESLISAYQKEIEHLYKQMSAEKSKLLEKEKEHADETNQLKTEIATMKLNHLIPILPSSPRLGQKREIERLNEELNSKSEQVMELHRDIVRLKSENAQIKSIATESSKENKMHEISDEKEKGYQKTIRALEKQVRTLQKLAFHKDSSMSSVPAQLISNINGSNQDIRVCNASASTQTSKLNDETNMERCSVLEFRISELENELMTADSACKEKVTEFQGRLSSLKGKYETRIAELEKKLAKNEVKTNSMDALTTQDLSSKLEKSYAEVANLKVEVLRYKREVDLLNKGSKSAQTTSRQVANSLSLALKAFKVELGEKEKELVRYRKEIADLNRTNLNLKREREKYLSNAGIPICVTNSTASNFARTKSDLAQPLKSRSNPVSRQTTSASAGIKPSTDTGSDNYGTAQLLQSMLEEERAEFQTILKEKSNLIEALEKQVRKLEEKLDKLDIPVNRRDSLDEKNLLLEDLRSRIMSQNKIIETMESHLSSYSTVEVDLRTLKQEKAQLEFRIRELNQQLVLAKTLSKPEHDILGDLIEKIETLNSRYNYREKQIDALLTRLSLKNNSSVINMLSSQALQPDDSFSLYGPLDNFPSATNI